MKFIDVVHFTVHGFKTWHGGAEVCQSKVTFVSHIVSVFSWYLNENSCKYHDCILFQCITRVLPLQFVLEEFDYPSCRLGRYGESVCDPETKFG